MTITGTRDLERIKQEYSPEVNFTDKTYLMLCSGTGCRSTGSTELKQALEEEIEAKCPQKDIRIVETGCNGFCAKGPIMVVQPEEVFYQKLTPGDVPDFVQKHLVEGEFLDKHLYRDPSSREKITKQSRIPFFSHQLSRVLRNKGIIDPESIEHYIARDGYRAAASALLEMSSSEIISEIQTSGLRGLGGAGFPTHKKWLFTNQAQGERKYVLCNADEGDPGAFMDRSILEADPHAVLEGMIIAAAATGATQGYIYCRTEYPLAIRRLQKAIFDCREYGLLGENIMHSKVNFELEIYQGAGAFVCGEETALMRSIEGKRGMPRPKPPFPAHKGLWDQPSVLNNVETLANVPGIIRNGGDWFAEVGTQQSKGTKAFALSGDINNIGLVEVPMGTPLRSIIYDIGGGIPGKKEFKAVQLGGPSGGCVSGDHLDLPVDFESLARAGAIMGSGGMIVMDESSCMVDMARFFMEFVKHESCGKCTPCREGTTRLLELLDKIKQGEGEEQDLETMRKLSESIMDTSLCGLGQSAPNPILSILRYFQEEFQAHIFEKRCPAKKCPELLEFVVDPEKCTSCGMCYKHCPVGAVSWQKKEPAEIDRDKCIKCMNCFQNCKFDAIY